MTEIPGQNPAGFIPAQESKLITSLFGWYAKWLFRSRFKKIWLKQSYRPATDSRTIYYLNHSSWWDGLIPLLLNRYLFHQRGRAMMEDKQMHRYRFFRWIGAFSVNLDKPRHSLPSLRYALDSMKRDNASLYIYPEGKIVPFTVDKPHFRGGLTWLCDRLPEVEVVPVGIYIHTMRHSKPELHISIGEAVDRAGFNNYGDGKGLQHRLELSLQNQLIELQKTSGFDDSVFQRWL